MTKQRVSDLEQLVLDYVWGHPDCTVADCHLAIARDKSLKENTVRTLFQRLEKKGYLVHNSDGRAYTYRAADGRQKSAAEAVRQIIDRFCGGSLEELLVGMVENDVVDREELAALSKRIADAKNGVKS